MTLRVLRVLALASGALWDIYLVVLRAQANLSSGETVAHWFSHSIDLTCVIVIYTHFCYVASATCSFSCSDLLFKACNALGCRLSNVHLIIHVVCVVACDLHIAIIQMIVFLGHRLSQQVVFLISLWIISGLASLSIVIIEIFSLNLQVHICSWISACCERRFLLILGSLTGINLLNSMLSWLVNKVEVTSERKVRISLVVNTWLLWNCRF